MQSASICLWSVLGALIAPSVILDAAPERWEEDIAAFERADAEHPPGKGGVLFIGATNFDRKFRAYDKLTGALLWETVLPFAGSATPSTYTIDGRQFVVIVCGGGKNGAPSGSSIVAFALPE